MRWKIRISCKGSVLVFSLVVLSFMLVSALSISIVSMTERKSAGTTERSSRSFQVADSGVEALLQKIYKGNASDLNALASAVGGGCVNGVISGIVTSGNYRVSFYDNSGTQLANCTDTTWRDKVVRLKSEGTSNNTTRAVEVGVVVGADGGGCVTTDLTEGVIGNKTVNGQTFYVRTMAIIENLSMDDYGHNALDDTLEIYCVTKNATDTYGAIALCLEFESCPWN